MYIASMPSKKAEEKISSVFRLPSSPTNHATKFASKRVKTTLITYM